MSARCTRDAVNRFTTTVSVTTAELKEKGKVYTVYKVEIAFGERNVVIFRRYNEFTAFTEKIKKTNPELASVVATKLPGKKLFQKVDPEVLEKRRAAVNQVVQALVTNATSLANSSVRGFLSLDSSRQSTATDDTSDEAYSSQSDRHSSTSSAESNRINLGFSERSATKPDDFEFLKVIGKGSFGKVLLARHKADQQLYAVKVLSKSHVLKTNETTHIMAERNVLICNVHHPFLIGLHYSFQTADKLYFVVDYVNGGELFFHLQRERFFSEDRSRFYAAEIASALGYLHSLNIIYRDLKPENILFDAQGHVALTDFGLCKQCFEGKNTASTFCGTPEYLAPDVLLKKPYDRMVDWWCLGAVLYEMLFGLPPFYSRNRTEMYEKTLNKPVEFRAKGNASEAAIDILQKLLEKDTQRRLGAVDDFEEICRHKFFAVINWNLLNKRLLTPPVTPDLKGDMDFKHIDPEFVQEQIPASVEKAAVRCKVPSTSLASKDAFHGFSYEKPEPDLCHF